MNNEMKNDCQCNQAVCGCEAAPSVRCDCGETCDCNHECRCEKSCACSVKQ